MRLAVLSDIHSNLAALEAVAADIETTSPDVIVVAGDFINRGPQPREVLAFLRDKNWMLLRGNHEDYVLAQCVHLESNDPLANPIWQPARWTAEQIGKRTDDISSLPIWNEITAPNVSRVLIVHGTPQINGDGVFGHTTDDEIRSMLSQHNESVQNAEPVSLFVGAHTHVPLMRRVDETLVVNVGATGLPFNGDPRAQYGVFTWRSGTWNTELRQVEYSRALTMQAARDGGFLDEGGPLSQIIMREVETAKPHLGPWVRQFGESVRAGQMSVEVAVEAYLS